MSNECRPVDDLVEIALLPEDDPRRVHLENCARCRTELAAYHAFSAGLDLPDGADPEDARSRVSAVLQKEILREASVEGRSALPRDRVSGTALRRLLDRLRAPSLRPVYAVVAAVLLVLAVQQAMQRPHLDGHPDTLRGDDEALLIVELNDAEIAATGAVSLSWKPLPGTEAYVVNFYRSDLSEIAGIDAGMETSLFLGPERVRDLIEQETILLWEVSARREGEVLATSPVASVRIDSAAH